MATTAGHLVLTGPTALWLPSDQACWQALLSCSARLWGRSAARQPVRTRSKQAAHFAPARRKRHRRHAGTAPAMYAYWAAGKLFLDDYVENSLEVYTCTLPYFNLHCQQRAR